MKFYTLHVCISQVSDQISLALCSYIRVSGVTRSLLM